MTAASPLVPGLDVMIVWVDAPPPPSAVEELQDAVGRVPVVLPLVPVVGVRGSAAAMARRTRQRSRAFVVRSSRKVAKGLVSVRGGTRVARVVVRMGGTATRRTGTHAPVTVLRANVPAEGPVLIVATDTRAASALWEVTHDEPRVVGVMGIPAAARLVQTVAAAGVAWEEWVDVAGDADPDHVYTALPSLVDGTILAPHDLRAGSGGPVALGAPPKLPKTRTPRTRTQPSLLVGPSNYAGMGAAWARAAGTHLGVQATNMHVVKAETPYAFAADHPVTTVEWPLDAVRRRLAEEAVGPATHVLLESMRPIVDAAGGANGGWDFEAGARDVEALLASGRTVGLLFHGSESRRPARHAELYPHSPFAGALDKPAVASLVKATDTVHGLLESRFGDLPRFVSTPDMLDFVPGATWLPNVVRHDAFDPGAPLLSGRLPVVLHAPSSALMKGSDVVDDVLGALHKDGVIEYRRLKDVPPSVVADHVRAADLVVDQVHLGNIGVLALEAMACGRVVLGHAIASVLARYEEEVPLVVIDPTTLRDRLLALLADTDEVHALGKAGPEFVRRHHDGRRSADVLAGFLGLS